MCLNMCGVCSSLYIKDTFAPPLIEDLHINFQWQTCCDFQLFPEHSTCPVRQFNLRHNVNVRAEKWKIQN